jgi:ribonuclease Z
MTGDVVTEGRAAWLQLSGERRSWVDWLAVGRALQIGRTEVLKIAGTNRPVGTTYNRAMGTWLRNNGLADFSAQKRHSLLRIMENLAAIRNLFVRNLRMALLSRSSPRLESLVGLLLGNRRRAMLRRASTALILSLLLLGHGARAWAESDFRVTLLGTGVPFPYPNRSGPSTLVEAGNQKLLFDVGRGTTVRLRQLKIALGRIDTTFLTHYHSDHTAGIPDLWLTGWLDGFWAGRSKPFEVIGPVGAKNLMANLEQAYALDIKIRFEDEGLPPAGIATIVQEFEQDGVVYDRDGVKVTAFTVDHGQAIKPAVGYRIDYKGHSVLISGDTRYDENVIRYGTGVDLLVHEVCIARPEIMSNIFVQRVVAHHTTPQEAGRVFSLSKPKVAAYTHLIFMTNDKLPQPTPDDLVAATREIYAGPLEIGEDLMSFEIDDKVTVHRWKP